jgi:hypothetical protein
MTAWTTRPRRTADLNLRSRAGPIRARVHFPAHGGGEEPPLVVALGTTASTWPDAVVLEVAAASVDDGLTVLEWAADHVRELGADPARLRVAGALAAAVAGRARLNGWPPVTVV